MNWDEENKRKKNGEKIKVHSETITDTRGDESHLAKLGDNITSYLFAK